MEEELELFKDMTTNKEKEEETPLIINGDVFLTISNYEGRTNLKTLRHKITKPLKQQIKKRDNKTCMCCGKKFENHLEVHHIMPLSKFPELACIPENLVSLCQQCHNRYHALYKDNGGAVSFANFLRQYGVKK